MVVAITVRQWRQLLEITGATGVVTAIERELPADFSREGDRYRHRDVLVALLRPWFAARTLDEVEQALQGSHVLWSPFRHLVDLATELAAGGSAVVTARDEEGLGAMLVTDGPLHMRGEGQRPAPPAPVLGADTADITQPARDGRN
jgi:2-methylfumaryl-CoA isomerase